MTSTNAFSPPGQLPLVVKPPFLANLSNVKALGGVMFSYVTALVEQHSLLYATTKKH